MPGDSKLFIIILWSIAITFLSGICFMVSVVISQIIFICVNVDPGLPLVIIWSILFGLSVFSIGVGIIDNPWVRYTGVGFILGGIICPTITSKVLLSPIVVAVICIGGSIMNIASLFQ